MRNKSVSVTSVCDQQTQGDTKRFSTNVKFWLLSSSLLKCRFRPQSWPRIRFHGHKAAISVSAGALTHIYGPPSYRVGSCVMRLAPCLFLWGHITVVQPEHLVKLPVISRATCRRYCLCREINCIHYTVGFSAVFLQVSTNAGETNPSSAFVFLFLFLKIISSTANNQTFIISMIFDPELRLVSEADSVVQAVFYKSVIKWKY